MKDKEHDRILEETQQTIDEHGQNVMKIFKKHIITL
jgi:SepF-like predicted cell division protein (DUF552 family)